MKRRPLTHSFFIQLCVIWGCLSVSVEAAALEENRGVLIAEYEVRMKEMIKDWERRNKTVIDSRMAKDLAGEIAQWRETYGFDWKEKKTPKKQVLAKLDDDNWLSVYVHNYFDALSRSPQKVKTLFARLAEAIGYTAEQAGWPGIVPNAFVVNDLREQIPRQDYKLISDGKSKAKYQPYRRFIVGPGQHELRTKVDKSFGFTVELPTTSSHPSKPLPSGNNPRGRRQ